MTPVLGHAGLVATARTLNSSVFGWFEHDQFRILALYPSASYYFITIEPKMKSTGAPVGIDKVNRNSHGGKKKLS